MPSEAGAGNSAGHPNGGVGAGTAGGGGGGTAGREAGGAGAGELSAGEGGEGGDAGAANGGSKSCTNDSECDDGVACDGVESCDRGACVDGKPMCAGEAESGCTVTCTEDLTKAQCTKVTSDADGDGHAALNNTCSANDKPADDCDDKEESTYPAADEACDGVDSDCDQVQDIDDGWPLGGSPARLAAYPNATNDAAAAWSDELGVFGLYYFGRIAESGPSDERFAIIDRTGVALTPVPVDTPRTVDSRLAAGHGAFGHLFKVDGQDDLSFRRFEADGSVIGSTTTVRTLSSGSHSADLVATSQGWVAAWVDGSIFGRRLSTDGTTASALAQDIDPDATGEKSVAAVIRNNQITFAYDSADGIYVRKFSDQLVALGDPALVSDSGTSPALVDTPGGYGVAWLGAWPDVMFAEVDTSGAVVCGPVKVGENTTPLGRDIAVAARDDGFLVAHGDNAAYRVLLRRVAAGCQPLDPPLVIDDAGTALKGGFELHVGSGFLALWREPSAPDAFYRLFGPHLCD